MKKLKEDLFGFTTKDKVIDWIKKTYQVKPLFLCIAGSHMWGLNTKHSDLDIRGVYLKPTREVLSIHPGRDTIERVGAINDEVDIQLYELGKLLRGLLKSNGNYIEMLLSPLVFYKTENTNWREIGKKSISKKLAAYYKGYAHSQRKRAAKNRGGKALLYTYREIMAGIWLMRTKKIIFNFLSLKRDFEKHYGFTSSLLDWSLNHKDVPIEDKVWEHEFKDDWQELIAIFEDEKSKSELPESVENTAEFNELLLKVRLKRYEKRKNKRGNG